VTDDETVDPLLTLDLPSLLDLLPSFDTADLMAIEAAYRGADVEALTAARATATAAAKELGLGEELDRLQGSILQWAGSTIFQNAAYPFAGLSDRMLREARIAAVPALVDAAVALLLDAGISDEQRELLLESVGAAVG
jgi:hypothetical protein